MAAAIGNQYAAKSKRWQKAIENALAKRSSRKEELDALDELADKLLDKCAEGDLQALRELGDRLDGKSVSSTELSGPNGGALPVTINVIGV